VSNEQVRGSEVGLKQREEVPRLRTRPPVEVGGFFLRRNPSPQRTIEWRITSDGSDSRNNKEAFMTQVIAYGIAAIVVSIGAALWARPRRAAYVMVRGARPERPRVW